MLHWLVVAHVDPLDAADCSRLLHKPKVFRPIPRDVVETVLEEFGKDLATLGIKYSDGPHLKPDGGGIAFIDAPEGYEVELIQMAKTGPGS